MRALRIDLDANVTDLNLTQTDAHPEIRELLGAPDAVDQGAHHPRAVMHIHGSGRQAGLPQTLAAWAPASAWRGISLCPLTGAIVVTGRTETGDVTALDDDEESARAARRPTCSVVQASEEFQRAPRRLSTGAARSWSVRPVPAGRGRLRQRSPALRRGVTQIRRKPATG